MSETNHSSSMVNDDHIVPLDLRYNAFLNALSEIHDEAMRDRCYKYWTSLYRYFDRSVANERALMLEEKRTCEILHRFNIEIASRQSEIAYQVCNILQRGHQVLADLLIKYDIKKNNLREIKQSIDHLEDRIQIQRSQTSIKTVSSSKSLCQITETINNLKLQVKNLQITRETLQAELNTKKANYVSMQIQTYHIQQNIHKAKKELIEIQHELTFNLKAIHDQNNQLNEFLQYKQNIFISIDQEYLNIDHQSIQKQLNNEQKTSLELKQQNKQLNKTLLYHLNILKLNENNQTQLNMNDRDLIKTIHIKLEQIKKEKNLKQEISQSLIGLKTELKIKIKILSTHHQQEHKLKTQITELENKRENYLQHNTIENLNQSTNNLKQDIHQEINHRLKLTIIHNNLKHQINTLKTNTQQHAILVKEQRQKVMNYEKLHDTWIRNININRNRLLELFNRINTIEQSIINTEKIFQQFNYIKLSLRPNMLIFYNEIHLFIERRREKDNDLTDESKSSLNLKLYQTKQILHSNQSIIHQIQQKISLITQNHSILLDQKSTIDKQRYNLTQHIDSIHNKWFIQQQQRLNIFNKINHIKNTIDLNNKKVEQFTLEKQKIILFSLNRQHLIVLIGEYIELNNKNLKKRRLCYTKLINEIRRIRSKVLHQMQQIKPFRKQQQSDIKQQILHLRKELLEYKKKNNHFQHRIYQRHLTQQILTKSHDKSIVKENNEQYLISLQQKASSIIYRLICKTHYNIILYKRLDFLMHNIVLLYDSDQQTSKKAYIFNSHHLDNQLKASIAELRVLKNETIIYQQIHMNTQYSLKNCFLFGKGHKKLFNCRR